MNQSRIVKHTYNAIFLSHVALKCHTCAIWWTGVDYRRCYDISSANGELSVMIQLNPLSAYGCISAMDMSLNVSCVESCSHYNMYGVTDNSLITPCIQTMEEPYTLFTYSQYRCQPALYLMLGWSGSFRLQNRMGFAIWDGTMIHAEANGLYRQPGFKDHWKYRWYPAYRVLPSMLTHGR